MVDFDGDKNLDLIVGCFQGFVYLVRGLGHGTFAAPERLKDAGGADIHLGEFWDETARKWGESLNAGDAVKDLCVNPIAVDWDGDGDLDLVMGGYAGYLGVRINEGTREKPRFAAKNLVVRMGDAPFKVKAGACAAVADWDGDGRWDLVCADSAGSVVWLKNTGQAGAPKFETAKTLIAAPMSTETQKPQHYLKIDVADWNADGKLDLIVGAQDGERKGKVWVYLRR